MIVTEQKKKTKHMRHGHMQQARSEDKGGKKERGNERRQGKVYYGNDGKYPDKSPWQARQ